MSDLLADDLDATLAELRLRYGDSSLERVGEFLLEVTGRKPVSPPHPAQRPDLYYFPGLTSRPWHDAPPPWMSRLEEGYPVIRRELDALRGIPGAFVPHVSGSDTAYRQEKFHLQPLSDRWTIYDLHEPEAETRCPGTVSLVGSLFRAALGEPATAQFSALRPGSRIPPHCGVANFLLTAHLGLVVPDGCRIRVGGETRAWTEGKGCVFDDSYEHEVWHDGNDVRIVLVLRFWHPELTPEEIEAIGALHERVIEKAGGNVGDQRAALAALRGAP